VQQPADHRRVTAPRFSDLTNKITDDEEVVRIVVEQHPFRTVP
jgi:hypothetical protein